MSVSIRIVVTHPPGSPDRLPGGEPPVPEVTATLATSTRSVFVSGCPRRPLRKPVPDKRLGHGERRRSWRRSTAASSSEGAHLGHLNARDTTLAFVSRAPQPDIERWKARMGWEIPWYTITGDFDSDFGVDEWHGTNAFIRDGDRIFRTYFVDNRGDEAMGSTWSYLDITALGRQEEWEDSPEGYPQSQPYRWWNLHDEYEEAR